MRIDRAQLPVLDSTSHEFITLVAQSNLQSQIFRFQNSKPILLSMKSGFVFIQTDKPLYTPSQTGTYTNNNYRLLGIIAAQFLKN